MAEVVYSVRVGPETPDQIFEVVAISDVAIPNQIFLVSVDVAPADQTFYVGALDGKFKVTTELNYDDYTLEELEALLALELEDLSEATEIADEANQADEDAQEAKEEAQEKAEGSKEELEQAVEGSNAFPKVDGESSVDSGKDGPDVAEWIAVEISIAVSAATGNGDDGNGVITNWDVPLELRFNMNSLVYVSGEKVAGTAQLLELDAQGGLPTDANGSLLATTEGIIDPDLFEDGERFPDQTFFVDVAAAPADGTFAVRVFADPPEQIFDVTTFAEAADQIFDVLTIKNQIVDVAQPPFIVKVFAEAPDQAFSVKVYASEPDQTFFVTRGPDPAFKTFDVIVGDVFEVTTSFAIPGKTFSVELGPRPAPTPDFTFNISVGGPDAPPVPDPFEIFEVTTSYGVPFQIFFFKAIETLEVKTQEAPFVVEVFAEPADQVFEVRSDAQQYDTKFDFTVGPEIPVQIFETTIVNEFAVETYKAPLYYSVQQAGTSGADYRYVVSGNGLSFADQPELTVEFGQQLRLQVSAPANALWIKQEPTTGPGEIDADWADLLNQGSTSGFVYFRPWQVGTYYYQSEFFENCGGVITVTGTSADAPDQTFDVNVGADPTGFDELFVVRTGAVFPDEIFVVTAEGGAPPASQYLDVVVGPEIPNEVFEVRSSALPAFYSVINVGASDYRFTGEGLDGEDDPTLTFEVGQSVTFAMNAPSHPMWIKVAAGQGRGESSPVFAEYMFNNGAQFGGINFAFNAPGTYYYNCEFHNGMGGEIIVTGDASPQKAYAVSSAGADDYVFTGEDLVNEIDPDLQLTVGEELVLAVLAVGYPIWIKNVREEGEGEAKPIWANDLNGNGMENGKLRVRFNTPGTYYYVCENRVEMSGTITVTT